MSDLLKTFIEELENIDEADLATKEQAREGLITGFKERADSEIYKRAYDFANNDENFIEGENLVRTLINDFGMHPSMYMGKKFFVMKDDNGYKHTFRPSRLDIKNGQITIDFYKNVFVPEKKAFIYSPIKSEVLSINKFINLTNSMPNEKIRKYILKDDPENDPDFYIDKFNLGKNIRSDAFASWAELNNEDGKLDKYTDDTLKLLYYLIHREGYNMDQAIKILKDKDQLKYRKFIKDSINEAKAYTSVEDNREKVKAVLNGLGINNPEVGMDFTKFPFKIEFDQPEDPDDTKPTQYYLIAGIPNDINSLNPSDWKFDTLYVKDADPNKKGEKAFPMKIIDVRRAINNYLAKTDNMFSPDDEWYTDYYIENPTRQSKIYDKDTALKGKDLPKEIILFVLDMIDKNPTKDEAFKYVKSLVDLYKREPGNPLIGKALRSYDPDSQCTFKKSATNSSGYLIYYPNKDEMQNDIMKTRKSHGQRDIYKRITKGL